jgi:hypothetical protein
MSLDTPGTTPPDRKYHRWAHRKFSRYRNAVGLEKNARLTPLHESSCQIREKYVSGNIGIVMEIEGVSTNHAILNSSVCWSLDGVRLLLHIV